MSASDKRGTRRTKSQEAAADLKRRGVYHGKHQTSTNAPPIPNLGDVGSAAYRRLMQKKAK
jgi:hypothetical protein